MLMALPEDALTENLKSKYAHTAKRFRAAITPEGGRKEIPLVIVPVENDMTTLMHWRNPGSQQAASQQSSQAANRVELHDSGQITELPAGHSHELA